MHSNYTQLPPDGTGKRILCNKTYLIPVDSTNNFFINQEIQNLSGSVKLQVLQINITKNIIYTKYLSSLNEGSQFILGDSIYKLNDTSSVLGNVTTTTDLSEPMYYYIGSYIQTSHDNPYNGQRIDEQGQSYIRFAEGSQLVDGTGQSKFTQQDTIGAYRLENTTNTLQQFSSIITGNSSLVDDINQDCVKIISNTSSGDSLKLITNKYHIRPVGNSIKAEMLLKLGDTGKTNVVRRWGYFDSENGYFFELNQTILYVVKRTNVLGVVVDTKIAQTEWNVDIVDGTGISKEHLNIDFWNRYWIELNKGTRLRMGIYSSTGNRIICHSFQVNNTSVLHGIRESSLPFSFEQENLDVVGSSSEMSVFECNVVVEGQWKKTTSFFEGGGNLQSNINSTTWTPLITLRPKTNNNHAIALLKTLSASSNKLGQVDVDGRIKLEVFKNVILTDDVVWTNKTGSEFEYNKDATVMSGGTPIFEHLVKGTLNIDFEQFSSYFEEFICERIDGGKDSYTIAAKSLYPSETIESYGAIAWEEFHI